MLVGGLILLMCWIVSVISFNHEIVNMVDCNENQFYMLDGEKTYRIISGIDRRHNYCFRKSDLESGSNYDLKISFRSDVHCHHNCRMEQSLEWKEQIETNQQNYQVRSEDQTLEYISSRLTLKVQQSIITGYSG